MPIITPCRGLGDSLVMMRQADRREAQLAEGDDEVRQREDLERGDALRRWRRSGSRRTRRTTPARKRKPRPNFTTVFGSSFLLASATQAMPSSGLKMMTKSELDELFTPLGSMRNAEQRVWSGCSAAKRLNEPPDCSKNAQKMMEKRMKTSAAASFLRSSV